MRVDEVEPHYEEAAFWSRLTIFSYVLSAATSIAVLIAPRLAIPYLYEIAVALYVGSVISSCGLSIVANFLTLPKAENARRRQLITDTLGVNLTHEKTQNYYNNALEKSIIRLGAAVLENSLFSKTVTGRMVRFSRITKLLYLTLWGIIAALKISDIGILVFFTQFLFASELIFNHVKLECLHHRHSKIYDDLYSLFSSRPKINDKRADAIIIYNFASYEAAKAEAGIRQSSKIFDSINEKTSQEWNNIRKQLEI